MDSAIATHRRCSIMFPSQTALPMIITGAHLHTSDYAIIFPGCKTCGPANL